MEHILIINTYIKLDIGLLFVSQSEDNANSDAAFLFPDDKDESKWSFIGIPLNEFFS